MSVLKISKINNPERIKLFLATIVLIIIGLVPVPFFNGILIMLNPNFEKYVVKQIKKTSPMLDRLLFIHLLITPFIALYLVFN